MKHFAVTKLWVECKCTSLNLKPNIGKFKIAKSLCIRYVKENICEKHVNWLMRGFAVRNVNQYIESDYQNVMTDIVGNMHAFLRSKFDGKKTQKGNYFRAF